MKVSRDIVNKRREEVMKAIQGNSHMSVEELAEKFNVSTITIRRDLQFWEDKGAIERYYGGASLLQAFVEEDEESYQRNRYMRAIAKRAASFVEDGDVIFVNSSLTATMIINYIKYKKVTIITNNARAINYNPDENVTVLFTGGEVRFPKKSLTGDLALSTVNSISANKCFMGCSGLSIDGITTGNVKEATINKAMMAHTKGMKFLLCDHTKFNLNYSYIYSDFTDCDYLITDVLADKNICQHLIDNYDLKIIEVDALKQGQ